MSKVAFITGITGQDVSYLAELLLDNKNVIQNRIICHHIRIDNIE